MRANKKKEIKVSNTQSLFSKKIREEKLRILQPRVLKREEDEVENLIRSKIDIRIIPPPFAGEIAQAKHARQRLKETIIKILRVVRLKKEFSRLRMPYRNDGESLTDYYRRLNTNLDILLNPKKTQILQQKGLVKPGLVISLKAALERHKKSQKNYQEERKELVKKRVLVKSKLEGAAADAIKERILSNIMYHIHSPFAGDKAGQEAYNALREVIKKAMLDLKLSHEAWKKRERLLSVIDIQLLPQKESETSHQYYKRLKRHLPKKLYKLKNPMAILKEQQRVLKVKKAKLLVEVCKIIDLLEIEQRKNRAKPRKSRTLGTYIEKLKSLQAISASLDTPIAKLGELRGNVRGLAHEINGFQKRVGKIKASIVLLVPSLEATKKQKRSCERDNNLKILKGKKC